MFKMFKFKKKNTIDFTQFDKKQKKLRDEMKEFEKTADALSKMMDNLVEKNKATDPE